MQQRMKKFAICSLLIAICGIANAAGPAPFSSHGSIQNVQNYSSNPFWSPDAPYNQRVMPVPVYVQGADLNSEDCAKIASTVIAYQCSLKNNCAGARLMDVKPAAMVQLSKLPGYNYVGACGGFLDAAFNDYVAKFPTVPTTTQQPQTLNNDFKIQNPYEVKAPSGAKTQREQELERLQSQNGGGAGANNLVKSTFPTIASDLSFSERMANAAAGDEQWKCNPKTGVGCAYQQLSIESDEKARERSEAQAESTKRIAEAQKAERCARNPNLPECNTITAARNVNRVSYGTKEPDDDLVQKIAKALADAKKK